MSEAKPYCISKHQVVEAYKQVKANRGAAGIDEQTITDFERKLKANLYKVWNRMSSGSYFPPPVRTVAIPKKRRRGKKVGHSHRVGSDRADGGQDELGTTS
jgi:RNA-directed DNA polymerase